VSHDSFWHIWEKLPFKGALYVVLLYFIGFAGMICLRAWRRRESVLDVIEFDGRALWKRAPIAGLILMAAVFLLLLVFNNLYHAPDSTPGMHVAPSQTLPPQEATPAPTESSSTPKALESSATPRQVVCGWGEYLNSETGRCVKLPN